MLYIRGAFKYFCVENVYRLGVVESWRVSEREISGYVKTTAGLWQEQLRETANYVPNALNTEASRELSKRSRSIALIKENKTALLSSTVLDDFENTMQACDETTEDDTSVYISSEFKSQTQLNDSAAQLKDSNSKCSDSCKISLKNKNKAQILCSLCMSWYHEVCIGIKKGERSYRHMVIFHLQNCAKEHQKWNQQSTKWCHLVENNHRSDIIIRQ